MLVVEVDVPIVVTPLATADPTGIELVRPVVVLTLVIVPVNAVVLRLPVEAEARVDEVPLRVVEDMVEEVVAGVRTTLPATVLVDHDVVLAVVLTAATFLVRVMLAPQFALYWHGIVHYVRMTLAL